MNSPDSQLKRNLTLPMVVFYGLGNILGAGIYVLIGEIAGIAGYLTPLAFLVAAIVASFTALSYCELSSRFPHSAGEAVYIAEGFRHQGLSVAVGFVVALAAVNSAATISHGFVGYLGVFVDANESLALLLLITCLGLISALEVRWAIAIAGLLTIFEIIGLLIIIVSGLDALPGFDYSLLVSLPEDSTVYLAFSGVLSAAFLAFYAYLGFEDMVNMAEETRDAERNLPKGILIALVVATFFYILVAIVALASVPPQQLSQSSAPLAEVYQQNTGRTPVAITMISLFAVVNGALIQIIMVSRLLYGMSKRGWIPGFFQRLNPKTKTPVNSTLIVAAAVLVFALWLPLETLAKLTSFFILVLFALVNVALIRIKRHSDKKAPISIPRIIPWCGVVLAILLIAFEVLL